MLTIRRKGHRLFSKTIMEGRNLQPPSSFLLITILQQSACWQRNSHLRLSYLWLINTDIEQYVNCYVTKWATIVLIIEQSLTTDARLQQQIKYSQPMKDGRRALPIRWDQRVIKIYCSLKICSTMWFVFNRLNDVFTREWGRTTTI